MSTTQVLIAGFGGQGILFAGKFLAYAGLLQGRNVRRYRQLLRDPQRHAGRFSYRQSS